MAELIGTWHLIALRRSAPDGSRVDHPLGEHPHGVLIYAPDGQMSVHMADGDREPLSNPDPHRASEAEQARAYVTYIAYSGRFEVSGDTVVHRVETSSNPNDAGVDKVRFMCLSDAELVLRTPTIETSDGPVVIEVLWTRATRARPTPSPLPPTAPGA